MYNACMLKYTTIKCVCRWSVGSMQSSMIKVIPEMRRAH